MKSVTLYLSEQATDPIKAMTCKDLEPLMVVLITEGYNDIRSVPYPQSNNKTEHIQIEIDDVRFLTLESLVLYLEKENDFEQTLHAAQAA